MISLQIAEFEHGHGTLSSEAGCHAYGGSLKHMQVHCTCQTDAEQKRGSPNDSIRHDSLLTQALQAIVVYSAGPPRTWHLGKEFERCESCTSWPS